MDAFNEFLFSEFGFLLVITTVVWAGFFSYLVYILRRVKKLEKEITNLQAIENE